MRAFVLFCCGLVGLLLVLPGQARAHAVLLHTQPVDGDVLAQAPAEVMLHFNEPVTPLGLDLLGASGVQALTANANSNGMVHMPLPADLLQGAYLLRWRVMSEDGHPIAGAVGFVVGQGDLASLGAVGPAVNAAWGAGKQALAWLRDLGLMVGAGGVLFVTVFANGRRLPRPVWAGLALAIVAGLLYIGAQGALMANAGPLALFDGKIWSMALAEGQLWPMMLALLAGLCLSLAGPKLRIVGAALMLLSPAFAGHAAVSPISFALLFVHVLLAGLWLGALMPLAQAVRAQGPGALPLVQRFSRLALPAVLGLLAMGVGLAALRFSAPAELINSAHGRALLLKLALVACLLGLALWNRRVATPALAAGRRHLLLRGIGLEVVVAVLLLLATARLSHTPPPAAEAAMAPRTGLEQMIHDPRLHAVLRVQPGLPTVSNSVELLLMRPDGQPLTPLEAEIQFVPPGASDGDQAVLTRPATAVAPGRYALNALALPVPGLWQVRVKLLLDAYTSRTVTTELDIPAR